MIFYILSLLSISLSGIFNAVMDTLSHHYSKSIFVKYNPQFWNPQISWRNKYIDGDYTKGRNRKIIIFTDAWHLFKFMDICFQLSSITFACLYTYFNKDMKLIDLIFHVNPIIYSIVRNTSFSLFYNGLLLKKN
jgi:hypothetical protein